MRRLAILLLTSGVIVGSGMLTWRSITGGDVVVAQTSTVDAVANSFLKPTKKPIIWRIYTGKDCQSHAEEVEMKSEPIAVPDMRFSRSKAGAVNDWHTGPRRQYLINLAGRGEIEVADGKKILLEPGVIELIEDTTGKGHITRVIGNEERVALFISTVDQNIAPSGCSKK